MPQQSPIDIDISQVEARDDLPVFEVRYPERPVPSRVSAVMADGDTTADGVVVVPQVVVTPDPSDAHVELDGARFDLQSFHWHSPSEHLLDGRAYPLELHLVHRSAAGDLLVVGVLSDVGAEDPAIAPVFEMVPDFDGAIDVDLAALLPDDRATYRYPGSLTTAPFTEGVSWFVCRSVRTASQGQIDAHTAFVSTRPDGSGDGPVWSARSVQDLAGRVVVTDS